MRDWTGKKVCFECAKKLGANINIGRKSKGRCPRCHSEQMLFKVTEIPVIVAGEDVCPECAHPLDTHASTCSRSELQLLKREREEIIRTLQEFASYDPEKPLAEQLSLILRR